jgi:hypothetical protein
MANERALKALDKTILHGFACDAFRKIPGAIVSKMDNETRAALCELTSADTKQQRPIWIPVKEPHT